MSVQRGWPARMTELSPIGTTRVGRSVQSAVYRAGAGGGLPSVPTRWNDLVASAKRRPTRGGTSRVRDAGRQVDGAIGTLDALPGVVEAVDRFPVLLDSGVRGGADVVKALALGAAAVLVGRP